MFSFNENYIFILKTAFLCSQLILERVRSDSRCGYEENAVHSSTSIQHRINENYHNYLSYVKNINDLLSSIFTRFQNEIIFAVSCVSQTPTASDTYFKILSFVVFIILQNTIAV